MIPTGSVTCWIQLLKAGEVAASQPLWERYFQQLVELARRKLAGVRRAAADEEDVAAIAFNSFVQAAQAGRFPKFDDRNDLWQLLVMITDRRAKDLRRKERSRKPGKGKVLSEGALIADAAQAGMRPLDHVVGEEPTPEFAALVTEEFRRILDRLDKPRLKEIALLKMEGYTIEEIAARLGCVPRTIDRQLKLIRQILGDELGK